MNKKQHIEWDIYEIRTPSTPIHGIMLRGRIRKLGIEQGFNVLCENASDKENCVRFALVKDDDVSSVSKYLKTIISDIEINLVEKGVINPVLSKLKVNLAERYTLL